MASSQNLDEETATPCGENKHSQVRKCSYCRIKGDGGDWKDTGEKKNVVLSYFRDTYFCQREIYECPAWKIYEKVQWGRDLYLAILWVAYIHCVHCLRPNGNLVYCIYLAWTSRYTPTTFEIYRMFTCKCFLFFRLFMLGHATLQN